MPKVNLTKPYLFKGTTYGPGETDVPNEVFNSPALAPAFKFELHPDLAPEPVPTDETGDDAEGDEEEVEGELKGVTGVGGKANRKKSKRL